MPTPKARTELEGYNRIADAIEALTEVLRTNNTALVAALGNNQQPIIYVSPTPITVQPAAPQITVQPAAPQITVQPAAPQITVQPSEVIVQPNITVEGGGGDSPGSGCGCLSDLTCIIAPLAASQIQANKAHIEMARSNGFWSETDTPQWPSERDSDPPISYTPELGGSSPPPGFDSPPGGINGTYDPAAYNDYKCDMGAYIVDYLINFYQVMLDVLATLDAISSLLDFTKGIKGIGGMIDGTMKTVVVEDAVASSLGTGATTLTKRAATAASIELVLLIIAINLLLDLFQEALTRYIAYLKLRRHAMICALVEAKDSTKAKASLNFALEKQYVPAYDFGQGMGGWRQMNDLILSDMTNHLFACESGFDYSSLAGYGESGCADCGFTCDGATVVIDFNNGKQGWVNVYPPTPDNSFGEAIGDGFYCAPGMDCDGETNTGLQGFKQSKQVTVGSSVTRTFTQVCMKVGGTGAHDNHVDVYVNDVLAMSKWLGGLPNRETFYEVVSLNIEENKVASYPNENLHSGKFHGAVKVVRFADGQISGKGEARIFGVAFG